jgi:hypothetical protein
MFAVGANAINAGHPPDNDAVSIDLNQAFPDSKRMFQPVNSFIVGSANNFLSGKKY